MWPTELCDLDRPSRSFMQLLSESQCSVVFQSLIESQGDLVKDDTADDLEWRLRSLHVLHGALWRDSVALISTLLPTYCKWFHCVSNVWYIRASLAASATANTVEDSNLCVWLCPWAPSSLLQQRLHPSHSPALLVIQANLCWVERHDLLVPSTRTQLGRRSFHVAAPTVWNALPSQLRSASPSRGQFRAISWHRLQSGYLWEVLLKSSLFYIYITYI